MFQGEDAKSVLFITTGVGELSQAHGDGSEEVLGQVVKGSFVGEQAVLQGEAKRLVSLRAPADSRGLEALEVSRNDLLKLYEECPALRVFLDAEQRSKQVLQNAAEARRVSENDSHVMAMEAATLWAMPTVASSSITPDPRAARAR